MFESPCSSTELDAAGLLSPPQPLMAVHGDPCPQCKKRIPFRPKRVETAEDLTVCPNCQLPLMIVAGKYLIEKKIGEGGGGLVYQARHIHLEIDPVRAIKFLKPAFFQDGVARKRFQREIQVTAAVSQQNEHIVRLYDDFGEIPGVGYYYVMEFLEGKTLADHLADQTTTPALSSVLNIYGQICDAVNAAHKVKIIHRDLKPENVFLLDRQPGSHFVKVMDFGIAHTMEQANIRLTTQGALGTPAYMSPEQFTGQDIDERSDIYVMGSLLYEMLVGHPPFLSPDELAKINLYQLARAHLYKIPGSPRELRPDRSIPLALEKLAMKALEKEREDRYQSVQEMLDALQKVREQELSQSLLRQSQFNKELPYQAQYNRAPSTNQMSSMIRSTQNFGSKSDNLLSDAIFTDSTEQYTSGSFSEDQELYFTKQTPHPSFGLNSVFFESAPTVTEKAVTREQLEQESAKNQQQGVTFAEYKAITSLEEMNTSPTFAQAHSGQVHQVSSIVGTPSSDSFSTLHFDQVSSKFKNLQELQLKETGNNDILLLTENKRPTPHESSFPRQAFEQQQTYAPRVEKPKSLPDDSSIDSFGKSSFTLPKTPMLGILLGALLAIFGLYAMMTNHQTKTPERPKELDTRSSKLDTRSSKLKPENRAKQVQKKQKKQPEQLQPIQRKQKVKKVRAKRLARQRPRKKNRVKSHRPRKKNRVKSQRPRPRRKIIQIIKKVQPQASPKLVKIVKTPSTPGCPHDSKIHTWIRIVIYPRQARFSTNLIFSRPGRWYCVKRKKRSRRVYFKITAPGYQPCIVRKKIRKRQLRLRLTKDSLSNPLDRAVDYCY